MKISLTPTDLQRATPTRATPTKRLPGESHPFVPRSSIRNLTPPQHLESSTVVSGRKHEVSKADPLMQRIRELEAENTELRAKINNLEAELLFDARS